MAISIQIIGQMKPDVQYAEMLILAKDSDVINAVHITEDQKPDIILLDYNLMHNKSYLFVSSLLLANRESRIILVGNNIVDFQLVKCLIAGVLGYLERKDLDIFLIRAIKAVDSGEAWVSRKIVAKLIGTVSG